MKLKNLKALALGISLSALATPAAMAGVVGSQHDMRDNGTGQGANTSTESVCVFCHTPHGGGTTAPLWNHSLTTATHLLYSTATSSSIDGQVQATVGSISLACLSCHDGTQGLDSIVNQPGSGATVAGYTAVGNTLTGFANLGTDLSNDHPIGISYGEGACNGFVTAATDCPASTAGGSGWQDVQHDTINATEVYWIDTSVAGSTTGRDKTDIILYTRTFTNAGPLASVVTGSSANAAGPSVECGSCHDPHNDASAGTTSVAFLRIPNTASAVCTACHAK